MARLGDIGQIITGNTPKTADTKNYESNDIAFIKPSDIYEDEVGTISETEYYISEYARWKARILPPGCILVTCIGIVGKVAVNSVECAFNQQINAIIPNLNLCDTRYLAYAILGQRNRLQDVANAAVVPILNKTQFSQIEIPLPSLTQQRYISSVLDRISGLIAKRRAQLDKLDLLVKARFVEMFGECKTNPKNWGVCNLEDIAQVGSSKRVFVEELKESGVPFYRGTEIGALAEEKKIEPELFITEEHYEKLCQATGKPQIGDLLMPSICPDGRIWVVDSEEPFYFKDGRVLWVHQISANFNPVFLLYTLKDRIMTDYSSIASGTTFAELKIFSLKKCGVFNVPIQLQSQFAEFVVQIERLKDSISHSLEKLETMKKALMQEYFG